MSWESNRARRRWHYHNRAGLIEDHDGIASSFPHCFLFGSGLSEGSESMNLNASPSSDLVVTRRKPVSFSLSFTGWSPHTTFFPSWVYCECQLFRLSLPVYPPLGIAGTVSVAPILTPERIQGRCRTQPAACPSSTRLKRVNSTQKLHG